MKIINCYNTPGCLGYFSPPCYPEDQDNNFENGICVKGKFFSLRMIKAQSMCKLAKLFLNYYNNPTPTDLVLRLNDNLLTNQCKFKRKVFPINSFLKSSHQS